ncbi:GspE/PulE family protein [Methyloversatilis thermotolerans]|uniref:GspE/PulE family protein n=1 Tax=Methyloversatilis thermotolerans TaxID=1346290 RepID=UPI000377E92E|nr:GspE/PulE family protein [Methyloversatilis thermotolerans]
MSAVVPPASDLATMSDVSSRLAFFKNLQGVTTRIHATTNIDEIMLELSQDISALFNADRLTIYVLGDDRSTIVSKVKTGLNSFKDLRLPLTEQSIAGFVAMSRKLLNIRDVYDEAELHSHSPSLKFLDGVDRKTGYRTQQMLVAPIVDPDKKDLLGVVQLINNKAGQPFSPLAEEGLLSMAHTLAVAFQQRSKPAHVVKSKYDYLVVDGVMSAQEFDLASRAARRKGIDIEDVLVRDFQVKLPAIGASLAKFFGVAYETFKSERVKPFDLIKNLKREYLEEQQWVPVEETSEGIGIVALDPEKVRSSRVVNNIFPKAKLNFRVTTTREFVQTLDQFYGGTAMDDTTVGDLLSDMAGQEDDALDAGGDDVSAAADNELVRLVNKIIVDAYQQGASDIHIEPRPGKDKTQVRFRKDGSLHPYIEVPASYRSALVTRLKIMCDLDISERRKPQDGKIKFRKFGPLDIELRVATIPSAGGVEDVVMRILAAGEPIPMDKLGVLPHNLERLKNAVSKPYGLFFVCGPTGSGKTTTLHSILSHINTPETKIWTAEDPVEITQKGLRQVQINKKAGLDFAAIMRAFLRADPDVIMVGEMRDKETVAIGIEASLTGHLVFSTLHTNSAPESIVRLLDMGMDPFNFADALLGILAQRLAKRLCPSCKQPYHPDAAEMKHFLDEYSEELGNTSEFKIDAEAAKDRILKAWIKAYADDKGRFTLYRAQGCAECGNTGYRGRLGLHELMIGTDRIKKNIQERERVATMLATALEEGMRTLKMDGMEKVLSGLTDMKQVRSVCIK